MDKDDVSILLKQNISRKAYIKDMEINNRLLKRLITNYADSHKKLSAMNRELKKRQKQLDKDLEAAAGIQRSLLPEKITSVGDIDFAWEFVPSDKVGGDIFNVFPFDDENLGVFILDVSGHGVPASLVTVSVSQALDAIHADIIRNLNYSKIMSPKKTLMMLDGLYPMKRFDKYFSMVYAVINMKNMTLTYSSAGHPPPVRIGTDGEISFLEKGGTLIGLGGMLPFEEEVIRLAKGDKFILYTDGVTEEMNVNKEMFGETLFLDVLNQIKREPVATALKTILDAVIDFGEGPTPKDDLSLLGFGIK